uniref:Uncharacterized protein n=1 Tax=Sphaerodactylus townsendi TaxID=933632 RepID=A0ACB8G6U8_9SAUR
MDHERDEQRRAYAALQLRSSELSRERDQLRIDLAIEWQHPILSGPIRSSHPILDDPIRSNPILDDPILGNPILDDPIRGNPILGDPILGSPTLDDPILDDPNPGGPMVVLKIMPCYHHCPNYPLH